MTTEERIAIQAMDFSEQQHLQTWLLHYAIDESKTDLGRDWACKLCGEVALLDTEIPPVRDWFTLERCCSVLCRMMNEFWKVWEQVPMGFKKRLERKLVAAGDTIMDPARTVERVWCRAFDTVDELDRINEMNSQGRPEGEIVNKFNEQVNADLEEMRKTRRHGRGRLNREKG